MTAPKKKAPIRRPSGPINQSRAAGPPAPASAAATSPLSGAIGADGPLDELPEVELPEPEVEENDGKRAGFKTVTVPLKSGSAPIEQGGSVDREVGERAAAEASEDPVDLDEEIARIRKMRKPIGVMAQKLALPPRRGYKRHWFNDTAGRIEEAEHNGWTFVTGKDGKPISRCVGTGRDRGSLYAFAMEIPEVFWLEDMAARNQIAADKIDALRASPFLSKPGQAKATDKGKFYDPHDTDAGPLQVVKAT